MVNTNNTIDLEKLRRKDVSCIESALKRMEGRTVEDKVFASRAKAINVAMDRRVFIISEILKAQLNNKTCDLFFKRRFSQAVVISVLKDEEFTAYMIVANILQRTLNIRCDVSKLFIKRLYAAIINFDEYKKSLNSVKA